MAKLSKQIKNGKLSYEETMEALARNPSLLAYLSNKTQGIETILADEFSGENGLLDAYLQEDNVRNLADKLTKFSNFGLKNNQELHNALLKEDAGLLLRNRALKTKENALNLLKWENEHDGEFSKGLAQSAYYILPRRMRLNKEIMQEAVANPVCGMESFNDLNMLRQTKEMLKNAYKNKTLGQCQTITRDLKGFKFIQNLPSIVNENPLYVFNDKTKDRVKSSARFMRPSTFRAVAINSATQMSTLYSAQNAYPKLVKSMVENMPQRKIHVKTAIEMSMQMGACVAGDIGDAFTYEEKINARNAMTELYNTLREGEFNFEGRTKAGKFIEEHKETKTSKLGLFLIDNDPEFITKIHDDDLTPKMIKSVAMQNPALLQTLADRTSINEKTQRTMIRQVYAQIKKGENLNENMDLLAKIINNAEQGSAFSVDGGMNYTFTAKRAMAKVIKENPAMLVKIDINNINPALKSKYVELYSNLFKKNPIVLFENCLDDINLNKNTDAFRTVVLPLIKDNPRLAEEISEKYRNFPEILENATKLDELNQVVKNGQNAIKQKFQIKVEFENSKNEISNTFNNTLGKTLENMIKTVKPSMSSEEIARLLSDKDTVNVIYNKCVSCPDIDMKSICTFAVSELAGVDMSKVSTATGLAEKQIHIEQDAQEMALPFDAFQADFEQLSSKVAELNEVESIYKNQIKEIDKSVSSANLVGTEVMMLKDKLSSYKEFYTNSRYNSGNDKRVLEEMDFSN